MKEIVTDLIAEQEALDQFLSTVKEEQWDLSSPAEGWTFKDCAVHIAHYDEAAAQLIRGDNSSREEMARIGFDYNEISATRRRYMKSWEMLRWWREGRAAMNEGLMQCDPKQLLPWFATDLRARSFATARLMETWAHGLDCYDTVGAEPEDTDRLRHVAFMTYRARPYAYQMVDLEVPSTPLRLELWLPSGAFWSQGPEDAENLIRGQASEFCRVAVRRRHWKDMNLEIKGDEAKRFIEIAHPYAGPPGPGRQPKKK